MSRGSLQDRAAGRTPRPCHGRCRALLRAAVLTATLGTVGAWQCSSDVALGPAASFSRKGLALDDATLSGCPNRIPRAWPNANETVKSLRLFRSYDKRWTDTMRMRVWTSLRDFAQANDAKVLLGTQITCDEKEDEADWEKTKELAKFLGSRHVMGIAIGNELDILALKDKKVLTKDCISKMWEGGRLWRDFHHRVGELDALGMGEVPVTSVFTGMVLYADSPYFLEAPGMALVNSFLVNATEAFGSRFVFTFNIYPYFDPNFHLDPNTTDQCESALSAAACWSSNCSVPRAIALARDKADRLMNETSMNETSVLWIGETGWSSPKAMTLHTEMAACPKWSSEDTLQKFYGGFLDWNLDGPDSPDHVFYFTPRDTLNFGFLEHFGLIENCMDSRCKLRSPGYTPPVHTMVEPGHAIQWLPLLLLRISGAAASIALCVLVGACISAKVAKARSVRKAAAECGERDVEVAHSAPATGEAEGRTSL